MEENHREGQNQQNQPKKSLKDFFASKGDIFAKDSRLLNILKEDDDIVDMQDVNIDMSTKDLTITKEHSMTKNYHSSFPLQIVEEQFESRSISPLKMMRV